MWDVEKQLWRIPKGEFTFSIGHSSRQLVEHVKTEIEAK